MCRALHAWTDPEQIKRWFGPGSYGPLLESPDESELSPEESDESDELSWAPASELSELSLHESTSGLSIGTGLPSASTQSNALESLESDDDVSVPLPPPPLPFPLPDESAEPLPEPDFGFFDAISFAAALTQTA